MISKVSDCSPSSSISPPSSISPITPKGWGAIGDSITLPERAPKPPFIQRTLCSFGLIFLHLLTGVVQFVNWILKSFFGYASSQKVLYRELHRIAQTANVLEIREFLATYASHQSIAGYLFGEFLHLPDLYNHLAEILMGANVRFTEDRGFFCSRWKTHPQARYCVSSHSYQGKECYVIGHFLFWRDLSGNTRFQFEKSPLRGLFTSINHGIDYLRYRRDNEQQGVTGSSPYTEKHCLHVSVNPTAFLQSLENHSAG